MTYYDPILGKLHGEGPRIGSGIRGGTGEEPPTPEDLGPPGRPREESASAAARAVRDAYREELREARRRLEGR